MSDNVKRGVGAIKTSLSVAVRKLLRPLVRIMLREGFTYDHFAVIAKMAFVESAARDFSRKGARSSVTAMSALTGMAIEQVTSVLLDQEQFEASELLEATNPFARVLHAWHNDRAYVGPYGFPAELPFYGTPLSFTLLTYRHAPGVSPLAILNELKRVGAVAEVGLDVWKPLKQEYIEPGMTPENWARMATLVESLLATLENNTRKKRDNTDLFERTMVVDAALSNDQLLELQQYMKVVGGQFLQRVDSFAAIELQEKMSLKPGDVADVRAGLQCFLFVEPPADEIRLRDAIDFSS